MGLYDEQIKHRIKSDNDSFTRSFAVLAGSVMGNIPLLETEAAIHAKNAIEEIVKYYHILLPEIQIEDDDIDTQLRYYSARTGLAKRRIKLTQGWYKNTYGAILGRLKTESSPYVALLPSKYGGYKFQNPITGQTEHVNSKTKLEEFGYCFYKPLPNTELKIKDFIMAIIGSVEIKDFIWLGIATLFTTLVGMTTPYITEQLFGNVIEIGQISVLAAAATVLVGAGISSMIIGIVKSEAQERIGQKAKTNVSASMFMRILSLKPSFFRDKPSGELVSRLSASTSLCSMLTGTLVISLLTAVFSLVYIGQIFSFSPSLVGPALAVIAMTVTLSLVTVFAGMKHSRELMEVSAKEQGISLSLLMGVTKLKLAGAEKRAFGKWAEVYSKRAKLQYSPPFVVKFGGVLNVIVSGLSTLILYYSAVESGVTPAQYMAFNAAFGLASGAFMQVASMASSFTQIKVLTKTLEPILKELPESSEEGTIVDRVSGAISLSNVTFRYNENSPLVLDNISMKIKPGQYIAVCGATGCGKSTLMRLLLGFEAPTKGAVYYDGRDIADLDKKSLRKAGIGVVMQNGSLFSGDIYSNIIISAPWLSMDEAWEAAETAGIADDIRRMPMGMHTMISEGQGGVSGGQKQRLMIARAVASKPKILMLDEATSALDNITQKHVSDSLRALKCTRIVIAHRLSTIKDCDRIIMIADGKIAEDGTYDELIAKDGAFAELVRRQQI
ncbi:MAG: ATP-binding cassette domain-containing protein [Ruminococcus sp.]|jgi:NHLM bacteriocin system ABC transporter ATP-binding protein|nr:ATP-binding cassette domain-containing protein [Ruminococcus sp.]